MSLTINWDLPPDFDFEGWWREFEEMINASVQRLIDFKERHPQLVKRRATDDMPVADTGVMMIDEGTE